MPDSATDPEKAAFHVERAYDAATLVWAVAVKTGNHQLIEQAETALEAIKQAQVHLPDIGAQNPDSDGSMSLSDLTAVHQLGPDFTELRQRLGEALDIAERIDQARGRSYPEKIGGSCGWDLAEDVNQLLARVELAAGGATGKGLE